MGNSLTSTKISSRSNKPQIWCDDYLGQYHCSKILQQALISGHDLAMGLYISMGNIQTLNILKKSIERSIFLIFGVCLLGT